MLYYAILCYTMLYYAILYYTILCYAILYYVAAKVTALCFPYVLHGTGIIDLDQLAAQTKATPISGNVRINVI